FVCFVLQVAETDYIALCFVLVMRTVGTAEGLYKPVVLQVLIYIQGIDIFAVKASEEHVSYQQYIQFLILCFFRYIIVVVIKALYISGTVCCAIHFVKVLDIGIQ